MLPKFLFAFIVALNTRYWLITRIRSRDCLVVLNAPHTVLVERQAGKRLDRVTGEVYHTTFDWPQDPTVQARLIEPQGISETHTRKRLVCLVLSWIDFCWWGRFLAVRVASPQTDRSIDFMVTKL